MGVSGLWDIINDAGIGESRSLASLAVDGFEKNSSGRRGLRVGIDVSLWIHQLTRKMSGGPELGDNPALRTLFFRLCALAEWPIIPLFVFDGRKRPKVKRGSKMGKSGSLPLAQPMKDMLAHFGMQWCEAPGEAEAELACLNEEGIIDAIVTDDCDVLIFGGKTILRNSSLHLSGNKANPALDANGKASKHHVMVYTSDAVRASGLTRGALLLFALLSGGDYHDGIPKSLSAPQLKHFLVGWREEINIELSTNSQGCLKQRSSLRIPPDFPDLEVVANYVTPVRNNNVGGRTIRDNREISIPALAGFCEAKFSEWGHRSAIIKRFRTLLWRPAAREHHVVEPIGTSALLVRQSLGFVDRNTRYASAFVNQGNPAQQAHVPDPDPLFVRIVGTRNHVSTNGMLEFRAEVCPRQLVALAEAGIKGTRKGPPGGDPPTKKPTPEPESTMRMWIPASMLSGVHPALVEDFFESKASGKKGKRKGNARGDDDDEEDESDSESISGPSSSPTVPSSSQRTAASEQTSPTRAPKATTPPERLEGPLDWRSEVDRVLADAPAPKKTKTRVAAHEDREAKRRCVSQASFEEALRRSPPREVWDDDIIDLTSD
ncbi:PIN domain-like protein [Mycena alexandri]|uniref:PIN domain-like protein n=1 Tax=Mycena alexandri TaxID=1745969 RepID=A0AAD6X4Z1_9AGAR|nr:PIN domain-like protein [Mycena alexandri]